jgi:Tfp pilus assembly protein PilE
MSEVKKKTLGLAIASLVFGCLALIPLLGILFFLPAIILGIIALVIISKNKDRVKGLGLAISGLVLGCLAIFMIFIWGILAAISIPQYAKAVERAQEAKAKHNIALITQAEEMYYAEFGRYTSISDGTFGVILGDYLDSSGIDDDGDWDYSVSVGSGGNNFTITAERISGHNQGKTLSADQNGLLSGDSGS